jgi:hypothetical protein
MAFGDNRPLEPEPAPHRGNNLVDGSGDIDSLMRWSLPNAIPDEAIALMLAHPALPRAMRTLATEMLGALENDKAVDGLFKDAGRYVAAMSAIYLHTTGGLTLPKLKAMCLASSLLSPGRARALLSFMRYLKYLTPSSLEQGSSPALYVPTESLLTAWRDHLRMALDAAAILEPAVALVRDRLDDPDVLNRFTMAQVEGLIHSARTNDVTPTFTRIIFQRHAGTRIVLSILSAEEDAFPPRQPIRLSIAAAARRFRVSRIHIRRLIDEAQRADLLIYAEDGTIQFGDAGHAAVRFVYPVQFIRLLNAAAKTIQARSDLIRR